MPKKTPKPEEVQLETPAAVEPQAEAQPAAEASTDLPASIDPPAGAEILEGLDMATGEFTPADQGTADAVAGTIPAEPVAAEAKAETPAVEVAPAQPVPGAAEEAQKAQERQNADFDLLKRHEREVRELANECEAEKTEYEDAKEVASSKKKRYEASCERLIVLCSKRPFLGPLFESAKPAEVKPAVTTPAPKPEAAAEPAKPAAEPTPAANDAWREVKLDELIAHGAPKAIIGKLCDRSPAMDTLGKLSDYMNAKGQWWAKDLKCGCGPEKAQLISDAFSGWFFANPEKGGGVQGAEAKPEAAAEGLAEDGNENEVGGPGDELPAGEDLDQDADQPEFADDAPTDEPTDDESQDMSNSESYGDGDARHED